MTDPEALIQAHKQVEAEQLRAAKSDNWCANVMRMIYEKPLAEAGLELARLVDFALKTQHDEQFNREVRACVHSFWDRCARDSENPDRKAWLNRWT